MKDVHSAVKELSSMIAVLETERKNIFSYAFSWRFLAEIRFFESSFGLHSEYRTDRFFVDNAYNVKGLNEDIISIIALREFIESRVPDISEESGVFGVYGQYGYIGLLGVIDYIISKNDDYIHVYIEKFFDIVDYLSQELQPNVDFLTDDSVLNSSIFRTEYKKVIDMIEFYLRVDLSEIEYVKEIELKPLYQKWIS